MIKQTAKKIVSVLLSVIFIVSAFCGCSNDSKSETTTKETTNATTETATQITTETTTEAATQSSNPFDYLDKSVNSKDEMFEKMLEFYKNTDENVNIDEWYVVEKTDTAYIAKKDKSSDYNSYTAANLYNMIYIYLDGNKHTQINYGSAPSDMSSIMFTRMDAMEVCDFLNYLIPDCPSEYKFTEQYFNDKINDADTDYSNGWYKWSDYGVIFNYEDSSNSWVISLDN